MIHAESQAKYKKSEKGKATQGRWYKSATKRIADYAYKRMNPEKRKAHQIVYQAVKIGKLKKPLLCSRYISSKEECGDKLHAHHSDYSKPLKVVWLCPLHHTREHMKLKQESEVI